MRPQTSGSLQAILKRRQQQEFVGRDEQLALFDHNLALPPDDDRRRFIFSITGPGGAGKTWLLRRFRQLAESRGGITAWIDETVEDLPAAMGRIADEFAHRGHGLKTFGDPYQIYRQRRQALEADPEAPPGLLTAIGRARPKRGHRPARRTTVSGALSDFMDEEAFAPQTPEWTSYAARELPNNDEVRLVLEPVEVLTPLFLDDLRKVAEENFIALFFDTYEQTRAYLDGWVRDLLDGRYGELSGDIVFAIGGQHELDRNRWAPYEGLLVRLPLTPFTAEEVRECLARKGVTDEGAGEVIRELSGGLPLLAATLAAESPDDPANLGVPRGAAVERFLRWAEHSKPQLVAADAALPRHLNRDLLTALVGEEAGDALFAWVRGAPFVTGGGSGWTCHPVVRDEMLRHKHRESPQGWADLHQRLSDYYSKLRGDPADQERTRWRDDTRQFHALEALYHRLCHAPPRQLPDALNGFLAALKARCAFARRWAETVQQAGKDADHAELQRWGTRMVDGLKALEEARYESGADMLTALLEHGGLEERLRAAALGFRGYLYLQVDELPKALADLTEAIRLAPGEPDYWAHRGRTYGRMERYDEALADFSRALELAPNNSLILANRGGIYRRIERCAQALVDFNRAIELNPNFVFARLSRALTYAVMNRYEEARADFSRALELTPGDVAIIAIRGVTSGQMGRYEEALADFGRALALKPDDAFALGGRGLTYRQMGRSREARADFTRAIKLDPGYAWAVAQQGETFRQVGRYEEALADFTRALELDPRYAWALAQRGETFRQVGRYEEALADFTRALELDPRYAWALAQRGEIYRQMRRYEEALPDFTRALELTPDDALSIAGRAETYRQMRRYEEALPDFTRALELTPDDALSIAGRAETYRQMSRYEEALADFTRALELTPDDAFAIANRGLTYRQMGRYADALANFTRALEFTPDYQWALAQRAETYR
ncbi:MAG: tetratricopeptide repeat protein, partial [Candidatus Methylomirabilia bacterium]